MIPLPFRHLVIRPNHLSISQDEYYALLHTFLLRKGITESEALALCADALT